MNGPSSIEASPTFFTETALALRERLINNRKLLFAGISAILIVAAMSVIVANVTSGSASTQGVSAGVAPVKVDIGDPLVVLAPSDGRNGTALVLADGAPFFPLPGGGQLTYDNNAPFEAQGVKVEQIIADQGFWIGNNDEQRVFVHAAPYLSAQGSVAPSNLQEGQLVNVSGRMQPVPSDPTAIGVSDPQLVTQSEYVEANSVRLPT